MVKQKILYVKEISSSYYNFEVKQHVPVSKSDKAKKKLEELFSVG